MAKVEEGVQIPLLISYIYLQPVLEAFAHVRSLEFWVSPYDTRRHACFVVLRSLAALLFCRL
jgi:hypothetical protein